LNVTRALVTQGLFAADPFVLADVGASRGIAATWRHFEPHLKAYGFEPLVRECERLNAEERNADVRYYDYFVGYQKYGELFPATLAGGWSNQPFERTSAARALRMQAMPAAQINNRGDPDVVYTQRRTSLDAFFAALPGVSVDFIKVDTDGQDYEVLCGSRQLLDAHPVLGLLVETQFHGISHAHSNLFANIDRLAREHGFSLFDLRTNRYTRGVLPGHFRHSFPAETCEGQLLAADALYLRDVPAPGYEAKWNLRLSPAKLLKLACLFELFGLPDCAAELFLLKKDELGIDVRPLLDALARELHPQAATLEEVNRRFASSLEPFYPQSLNARLRRAVPPVIKRMLRRLLS